MATLTTLHNIFDITNKSVTTIDSGLPLYSYVQDTIPGCDIVVSVNGHVIDDMFYIVKPEDSIGLVPVLTGGGGGGKQTLRLVAMIALAVAAPGIGWAAVNAYAAASTAAITYAEAMMVYGITTMAVMMVGGMLINAIMPIPTPGSTDLSSDLTETSSTYSFSGGSNAREAGTTLPIMLGKARVVPPIIGSYISLDGDNQHVNILYAVNDGHVDSISDIYINDQPITNYTGCTYYTTLGNVTQDAIGNFRDTIITSSVGVVLNDTPTMTTFTTNGSSIDSAEVVISLANGLYYVKDDGGYESRTIDYKIEAKLHTATTWTTFHTGGISGTYKSPVRFTYKINLGRGKYDIRVTRLSTFDTNSRVANSLTLDYVNEITYDDFTYPGVALLSVNALATDQLNGGYPNVSCLVDNRTISVNGVTKDKSNPAWACYDLLKRYGISDSKINITGFEQWATFCTSKNLKCNLYLDNQMELQAALNMVSILGRCMVIQLGNKFSPIIDKAIDIPTQSFLFTSGNLSDMSLSYIPYTDRSNVIDVTYYDETDEYKAKTIQVQSKYFDSTTDEIKSSINLYGCTLLAQAEQYANFLLNTNQYVSETAVISVDVDAIACTVGDVIKIGKKYMTNTLADGRIVTATSTTITIDQEIYLEVGKTYEIQFRTSDDVIHTHDLAAITTTRYTDTFTVIGMTTIPTKFDVYAIGYQDTEATNLYRVTNISRSNDQKRKITAIEYNADVYNDASIISVEPVVFVTSIQNLKATDFIRKSMSGNAIECVLSLNWVGQALWYDIFLNGVKYARTYQNYADISNVLENKTYTVKVTDSFGKSETIVYTVIGRYAKPPKVTNLAITELGSKYSLSWAYPEKPIDFKEYIVYMNGVEIGRTTFNSFEYTSLGLDRKEFIIRAIDSVNLLSDTVSIFGQAVVPNPVDTVTASVVNGKLTMSWTHTKESDFSKYLIYKDTVVIGSSTEKTFSYTELGDAIGANIYYFVSVVDTSGLESIKKTTIVNITASTISNITSSFDKNNLLLKWDAVAGTFAIQKYKITINGDTYYAGANTFSAPVKWLGTKSVAITGVDTAGNLGTSSSSNVVITAPTAATITTAVSITSGIEFLWTEPTATTSVKEYEITYNGSLTVLADRRYFVPTVAQGTYTIDVVAIDHAGNRGTKATKSVTIGKPTVSNISYTAKGRTLSLAWTGNTSTFNIKHYKVSYSDGQGITQNIVTPHSYFSVEPNWLGAKVFTISAVDVADNEGNAVTHTATVSGPSAPTLSYEVVGKDVLVSIKQNPGSFDLNVSEIVYDGKTVNASAGSPIWTLPVTWDQTKTFNITSIDILGNRSITVALPITIVEGTIDSISAEVVDNNVLLRWAYTEGTLPVDYFRISKGLTYATAVEIGTRKGTFTPTFEQLGGVYTYWITPIDTAGNEGVYKSVTATVNEPPDYVLNANWDSDWSGANTNIEIVGDLGYLPVNLTETYQTHFTSRSWTTPQAQITAGYPLWLSPTNTVATYSQTFDYGALLPATSITITNPIVTTYGSGTYTMSWSVQTSTDNSTWTTNGTDITKAYVVNIRYFRIIYTFTVSNAATLLSVGNFNLTLNTKIRNDAGSGTSLSTDATGTYVPFNVDFIDIASITTAPNTTQPIYVVYDFLDVPNPTGFRVLAYDAQGHRITAPFSWSARGY